MDQCGKGAYGSVSEAGEQSEAGERGGTGRERKSGGQGAAVFCVGNRLMLDDGIGPAIYDALKEDYVIPDEVVLYDVGCMSLDMISVVKDSAFIVTVDAVDGTDKPAGTVFRFAPEDMARHSGAMASLHDLKLVDLFDAAALLGYSCEGICYGMQVENRDPATYVMGLTSAVAEALPLLEESVAAELARHGYLLKRRKL